MGNRYPTLTEADLAALRRYREKHGRMWKACLVSAWLGCKPHDDQGTLRNLRNTHGPSWLEGFRFPKEQS